MFLYSGKAGENFGWGREAKNAADSPQRVIGAWQHSSLQRRELADLPLVLSTPSLYNSIRRLFDNPNQYCSYVTDDQVVADLGCGPGYYRLALAESVGPEGRAEMRG